MPLYPEMSRGHEDSKSIAVATHLEQAWRFVSRHAARIGIGILALLVIAGLVLGIFSLQHRGDAKAREALWKGWELTDETEKAKVFEGIVAAHTSGTVAFFAQMELGKSAYGKKDFETALKSFDAARKLAQPGSVHEMLALYAVIAADLSLGKHAEALAELEPWTQSTNPHLADRALFQKGLILEKTGERDAAAELYRKLAAGEEFLDSPFREEGAERLLWLASAQPKSAK